MSRKNIHTPPSTMGMIGTDKPQFIPEQVHRAFVEEFFRNRTALAAAHAMIYSTDGTPIAYGGRAVIETSEERKDGFNHETR